MKIRKTIALLAAVAALGGCIGEDYSGCPTSGDGTQVDFAFTGDDGDPGNFDEHIGDVTLFVFDDDQRLIDEKRVAQDDMDDTNGMQLDLKPTSRRVVCWANAGAATEIVRGTSIASSFVHHPGYSKTSPEAIPGNDALYYGTYVVERTQTYASKKIEIPFHSAHVAWEVYISGLGDAAARPVIEVENLMPQYDFDMQPTQPYGTTYTPAVGFDAAKSVHGAVFNTLRFTDDAPVRVVVKDHEGTVKHIVPLKDYIAAHPEMSVEGKDEARIRMQVSFSGEVDFGVTVTIPDWSGGEVDPF